MKFGYILNSDLPPLAWIAHVERGEVSLVCGQAVECTDNGFVEGAWSGSFREMGYQNADWFCGTGGQVGEKCITFSTPSHVTYGLYIKKIRGGYYVSNSLYLLMAQLDYRYDVKYIRYEVDFNTILDGINEYRRDIRVVDRCGNVENIGVEYFRLIKICDDGGYEVFNKTSTKPFESFDDYYARLLGAMKMVAENAADSRRVKKYGMITTISRGYDAPCCAAIAKKIGCDTAITFEAKGKYVDDCGTEIAKVMGYTKVYEVDADEYLHRRDLVEAEYICSGELGAQISFSSFDKYIEGKLCFTGDRGDSIWSRTSINRNDEFNFEDMLSHLGSCERRLWLNYIPVPLPLFGASSWTSIYDISNSDEMKPWYMNNDYDRPIPRRIVEEVGVERSAFGIRKHGAGFVYKFDWLARILSRMSATTASSFKNYVKRNKQFHIVETAMFLWKLRGTYGRRLGIRMKTLTAKEYSRIANPMTVALLIPWAGEIMTEKYRKILRRE